MNPCFQQPQGPSLVAAIREDRIREVAELRLAAEVSSSDPDSPFGNRRRLPGTRRRAEPAPRVVPALHSR